MHTMAHYHEIRPMYFSIFRELSISIDIFIVPLVHSSIVYDAYLGGNGIRYVLKNGKMRETLKIKVFRDGKVIRDPKKKGTQG